MEKKPPKEILFSYDPQNTQCVDCGSKNPTKVSINHGITICNNCSIYHSLLGPSISYVRDISDEWDNYLFFYMLLGGNSKFLLSLNSFGIKRFLPIRIKYKTNGIIFYRLQLKYKVLGKSPPFANFSNPCEYIEEYNEDYFPEFKNYKIQAIAKEDKEKNNIICRISNFCSIISNRLLFEGNKTMNSIIQAGQFIADKTLPAKNMFKVEANKVKIGLCGIAKNFIIEQEGKYEEEEKENKIESNNVLGFSLLLNNNINNKEKKNKNKKMYTNINSYEPMEKEERKLYPNEENEGWVNMDKDGNKIIEREIGIGRKENIIKIEDFPPAVYEEKKEIAEQNVKMIYTNDMANSLNEETSKSESISKEKKDEQDSQIIDINQLNNSSFSQEQSVNNINDID